MTVALFLLSRLSLATDSLTASGYMLLLGLGLGMVMQILVMAVQNAVAYEQLGVATSGTTLFRSIGGSIGASLFGGIFSVILEGRIHNLLPDAPAGLISPAAIAALADPLRSTYLGYFVDALHLVFLTATGLSALAFLLSFALVEMTRLALADNETTLHIERSEQRRCRQRFKADCGPGHLSSGPLRLAPVAFAVPFTVAQAVVVPIAIGAEIATLLAAH